MDNQQAVSMERKSGYEQALRLAASRVAPLWPLRNFVAVNPYMGYLDQSFAETAQVLRRSSGAELLMPATFYLEKVESGRIQNEDVEYALGAFAERPDADAFLSRVESGSKASKAYERAPTVTDVAADLSGIDLANVTTDRLSNWAASYFDEGEASWSSPFAEMPLYEAWRAEAAIDRSVELIGIRGFRGYLSELPAEPLAAVDAIFEALAIPDEAVDLYLQAVAGRLSGWVGYAGRIAWDRRLHDGEESDIVIELLAVLLSWEYAIFRAFEDELETAWDDARARLVEVAEATSLDPDLRHRLILQTAWEAAEERALVETFASNGAPVKSAQRPRVQAVFCIDVRSEVFRRHLESTDSNIETLGFAGFFGMPIRFKQIAHGSSAAHCPALVAPSHEVVESIADRAAGQRAHDRRTSRSAVGKAWKAFKGGAVTCFGFVSPLGLSLLPKLFGDSFGLTRPVPEPSVSGLSRQEAASREVSIERTEHDGRMVGLDHETRVELALGALRGMSLSDRFGRLVVLAGHAASTTNNPHATGYDCGACSGRSGEPNARVAAAILNDAAVRRDLVDYGIEIPDDTWFLAALHDTTTDDVTVFGRDRVPTSHARDLARLDSSLEQAARASRAERAPRLGIESGNVDRAIASRTRDWAQVRPEWGLAGCSTFVVAPRHRTRNIDLRGASFLHTYDWEKDEEFTVLEQLMTAPMVVTSWINLQYYASTVDNRVYGSGNKTLHNVVGTVGVLEGNGGDLRSGLPWQAVHDGEDLQHDPLRLRVVIEAPIDAMNEVIRRHESVRHLVDNGWLHLYAMDDAGEISHRYDGACRWTQLRQSDAQIMRASA